MAQVKVPYLVKKAGAPLSRFYWQPSNELRALGWRAQRVPENWATFIDELSLELAAIARARALNDELAAWRIGADAKAPELPVVGSLKQVIAEYKADRRFKSLRASSQRVYRQSLDYLEEWAGDRAVRVLTEDDVENLYVPLQETVPARANNLIRVLRIVLEFARRKRYVQVNVAARPRLIGLAPSGVIWPHEAVTLFVAKADAIGRPSIGDAIALNEWLGQRQGDVLKMRPTNLRDGVLRIRQSKTGAGVLLPVAMVDALKERLEAAAKRNAERAVAATTIIVHEPTGRPYDTASFAYAFDLVRDAVAKEHPRFTVDYLPAGSDPDKDPSIATKDLQYFHLRHTAVVRHAEAGSTPPEISGVTGHTLQSINSILKHYLVRTGELAVGAFKKRLAKEQGGV